MKTLSTVTPWLAWLVTTVSVRQMAEIPVDDPAVIDDDVAPLGESLDGQQRAVAEAMLAVLGLAARRDAHAVADGQGELRRPVQPRTASQARSASLTPFAHDQPRSFLVARRILVELEQVARLIFGRVRFLRVRQVRRNPSRDDAFLAELAFRLQPVANRLRDPVRLRRASATRPAPTSAVPSFFFSAAAAR